MANKANPYTYLNMTVSICPVCHRSLPGALKERDGKIYMSKSCPEHGRFQTLIASDAEIYKDNQKVTSPSLMLKQYQTKTTQGCPQDCGVCPEHEQNNAVPVIEITNYCNLDCPICFADNNHDYMMSLDEYEKCLDILEASDSDVDILVLTGGEPTAHPKIVEMVERAYKRKRIPRVGLATNGILLAKREHLVKQLADVGAYVLFQLDSTDASKNQVLRGNEMTNFREKALENLEKHNVRTSILMTVIKGLNDDEIGSILKYTLEKPFLRGFEVQTIAYTGSGGRVMKFDPMTRITGTDLIHSIEAQSDGIVRSSDFSPMAHPHPNCVAITYVLTMLDGKAIPFPRFTCPELYQAAVRSAFIAKPDERHEHLLKEIIDDVFAREHEIEHGSMILATLKQMLVELFPASGIDDATRLRLVEKYVKNVFLHNYMDDHSFDASVLRKCTSMQIIPDGRMIPNCGYRVIHRKSDPRWQNRTFNLGHGVDGLRKRLQVVTD